MQTTGPAEDFMSSFKYVIPTDGLVNAPVASAGSVHLGARIVCLPGESA